MAKHAVTVEVALGGRLQPAVDGTAHEVHDQREAARPPGKMHGGVPTGADGGGVAPPRQR